MICSPARSSAKWPKCSNRGVEKDDRILSIDHGGGPFRVDDPGGLPDMVGPTGFDRILGVNAIGTKTAVLLVIIGTVYDRVDMFVDFAIAYALLNFVSAIVVSRYLNRTISLKEMEAKEKKAKA